MQGVSPLLRELSLSTIVSRFNFSLSHGITLHYAVNTQIAISNHVECIIEGKTLDLLKSAFAQIPLEASTRSFAGSRSIIPQLVDSVRGG